MPSASSSQDTTKNVAQTTNTNPWAPQSGYLTQGFANAGAALNQANSVTGPTNFTAQYTPEQLAAFTSQLGYGMGNPQIAASSAAAGGALTGAGAGAVDKGLYGLANYQAPTAQSISDNTARFSDNPQIQGMVDAATRDARRAVSENVLPGIDRSAAGSGNINSSRTGVERGIVERGLGDTVADTSAAIRNNAFNTGQGAALNLANLQQSGQLGALSGLTSGGTGAVGTGVGANSGAVGQQGGLYDLANTAVQNQYAAAQAPLTNQLQQYQFGVQSPFAGLNQYWNIVGGQNYGGTSNTTGTQTGNTTNNPSQMAQLGQYTGILSSLFGGRGYQG